ASTAIPRCVARVWRSSPRTSGSQEGTAYEAPTLLERDRILSCPQGVTHLTGNIVIHDLNACKCPEGRQHACVCLLPMHVALPSPDRKFSHSSGPRPLPCAPRSGERNA